MSRALPLVLVAAQALAAGAPVRVGSKEFTESVLLGDMATLLLRSEGFDAVHRRELGGTRILFAALRQGELDVYPEYTGTLRQELIPGGASLDDAGLERALAALDLAMTHPLGFDDTYAVGMREDVAERLGVRRISDLARHPELRLGFTSEFLERADGWPALLSRYRLPQKPRGMEHDLAYRALASGQLDATDLYSTDPEIRLYRLRVLEDDLRAFPEYQAVYLYRAALAPAAVAALRRLEGRLSAPEMISLNARAKIDRVPEARVAADFLRRALGVDEEVRAQGPLARIGRRTLEHLWLVGISLLAAIALAIPLGAVAARWRRPGRLILGFAGAVQTIPSLALLVFMIPLLGIGAGPAIFALFLYGLLPIVRNTHAGLTGIRPELLESADALGLTRWERLRLVELPLASPSILAGIKTSAVIDVGTATLGALIGAGGYGQPILSGIRLDDVPLILEGALPAAALALLVQAGFDALERVLIPRGLRPPKPG